MDLIDRQAAIDVVKGIDSKFVKYIEQLPSAQPEPIKINIEDFDNEGLERLKKECGNTPIILLPAQPEIIRCKDCKYNSNTGGNYTNCDVLPQMFGRNPEDNYCSYAERREE